MLSCWETFRETYERCRKCSGRADSPTETNAVRILLLGMGGVGKSTLVKQMQTINGEYDEHFQQRGEAFPRERRLAYRPHIFRNIFDIALTLVRQNENHFHLEYASAIVAAIAEKVAKASEILDANSDRDKQIEELLPEIRSFWQDQTVQDMFTRRSDFLPDYRLHDWAAYFMAKLDEVMASDYEPSIDDVLRVQAPTKGAHDYYFRYKDVAFTVRDVGGQIRERQNWFRYIDDCKRWIADNHDRSVLQVIYIASLADYDQVPEMKEHRQGPSMNRTKLDESAELLRELRSMTMLRDTSFILMLNKKDVFRESVEAKADFQTYFPDFAAEDSASSSCDASAIERAESMVLSKFMSQGTTEEDEDAADVFVRYTCATDTKMMVAVLAAVQDHLRSYVVE